MYRRRDLEFDALVGDTWTGHRLLLENALRRAGVGVIVGGYLQRREPLACRARGRYWRDWSARNRKTGGLERQRGARRALCSGDAQGELWLGD